MHFGILGQKWGIRRYQNPDGSLTPSGKARYLKPDGSLNKEGLKRARFDKFGDDRDTLSKELQRLDWNKDHPKNQQWQEISAWDPKALEQKRESSKTGGNITGKQVSDLMKKKGVTYEDIYLEMADDGLLDMESEDNDDFKKAEYEWYKKHSKEMKHSIGEDINMPWTNDQTWALMNKPQPEEIRLIDIINKPDPEEIYHHGTKGMRWGIRRYQNEDGTLTAEGRARYGYKEDVNKNMSFEERSRKANIAVATDYENVSKGMKGVSKATEGASNIARRGRDRERERAKSNMDLSHMSDQELREKVNRMNLERQYKDLATADVGAGKAYVSDVLQTAGDLATIAGGIATTVGMLYMLKTGRRIPGLMVI